jgi:ATP synthase protein I
MPDNPKPKPSGPLGNLVQAESMLQLALAVPAGCFAGLLIGYLLDRHFHTRWIVVVGMLLGSAGGFIQIFTAMSRMGKRGGQ